MCGPITARQVRRALAHEHMFVDFHGPAAADYMDVNWSNKIGAAVESTLVLRAQGADLVVDWTNIEVGRNALAPRSVARQSGVAFLCPTGIYKALVPPALAGLSVNRLAGHFIAELAQGIDGTAIRAGFIKTAVTESGATTEETAIVKAAALAARETGAAIGFHGPQAAATGAVARIVERRCGGLKRFVWAHAQVASLADNKALAARGAFLQYDAIGAHSDAFFGGPVDAGSMLARLQAMLEAGFGDQVLPSTDASVCVHPPGAQYDRSNAYLYRTFEDRMKARLGAAATKKILRDNVLSAFRAPTRL